MELLNGVVALVLHTNPVACLAIFMGNFRQCHVIVSQFWAIWAIWGNFGPSALFWAILGNVHKFFTKVQEILLTLN
jgi:hypothetical protein